LQRGKTLIGGKQIGGTKRHTAILADFFKILLDFDLDTGRKSGYPNIL
jgi:hypothetical protein